jgi:hypothetical protein
MEERVQMSKRTNGRPSATSLAAIAIAMLAMIAALGGAAVAGKGKKKPKLVTTIVTQTVTDPTPQNDNNGNYEILTATKECGAGTSAIGATASWSGTPLLNPEADQEWIVDIKRSGNGYTARGATDLNGTPFTIEVVCQKIK